MYDSVQLDTIVVSSIISGIIAITVAAYFRFIVKPKIETVFEDNRKTNFHFLFNEIEDFDRGFETFYTIAETRFGLLTKDRESLFPSWPVSIHTDDEAPSKVPIEELEKIKNQLQEVERIKKDELGPLHDGLNKHYDKFLKNYALYRTYVQETLLSDVSFYYYITLNWMVWVLKGHNYWSMLDTRRKYAFKIIKFTENDSVDNSISSISDFVTKWNKYRFYPI